MARQYRAVRSQSLRLPAQAGWPPRIRHADTAGHRFRSSPDWLMVLHRTEASARDCMTAATPQFRPLVSLHLPKTAGTSFGLALAEHFGAAFWPDYDFPAMQVPRIRRELGTIAAGWRLRAQMPQSVRCVHGHFLPLKYRIALGRHADFAVWLREPVDRLLSHYHFWRRDYAGADPAQPLRNRMIAEGWSQERFCLRRHCRTLRRGPAPLRDPVPGAGNACRGHEPGQSRWPRALPDQSGFAPAHRASSCLGRAAVPPGPGAALAHGLMGRHAIG